MDVLSRRGANTRLAMPFPGGASLKLSAARTLQRPAVKSQRTLLHRPHAMAELVLELPQGMELNSEFSGYASCTQSKDNLISKQTDIRSMMLELMNAETTMDTIQDAQVCLLVQGVRLPIKSTSETSR